jgi:hypothetical protein
VFPPGQANINRGIALNLTLFLQGQIAFTIFLHAKRTKPTNDVLGLPTFLRDVAVACIGEVVSSRTNLIRHSYRHVKDFHCIHHLVRILWRRRHLPGI